MGMLWSIDSHVDIFPQSCDIRLYRHLPNAALYRRQLCSKRPQVPHTSLNKRMIIQTIDFLSQASII
jgi:hypothetical protein